MNKGFIFIGVAAVSASLQAGSYSQNFDSYSGGTTNLNDGSTIADNGSGLTEVWDNGNWKALRLTQDGVEYQVGNFVVGDLDNGNVVTGFTATFDSLVKATENTGVAADGFAFNFGTLASYVSDGDAGMDATGSSLSVVWDTYYNGENDIGINVFVNGVSFAYSSISAKIESSIDVDFQSVTIVWDENGLDVIYGGTTVFENLAIKFTAESGAEFAFSARTGGSYEDVFIDNIDIQTVPEPVSLSLAGLIAGAAWFIRRRFCD
ncbi:MAG: hypothetical protein AB7E95_10545 [Kiritimatiellales bacterium]